jgi:hypothetical protein
MLKHISWSNYLITTALIATIYYVIVVLRFYIPDLRNLVKGKTKVRWARLMPSANLQNTKPLQTNEGIVLNNQIADDEYLPVNEDIDKIQYVCNQLSMAINDCASTSTMKQEFCRRLSGILQKYPPIKYSPYYNNINELILSECGKHNYNIVKAEELPTLWTP